MARWCFFTGVAGAWAAVRGVVGAEAPVEFDCDQDVRYWKFAWSKEKDEFCCRTRRIGCPDEEASGKSADDTAVTTTPSALSVSTTVPVNASAVSDIHDCSAGYQGCLQDWPSVKRAWCYKHEAVACNPLKKYNCEDVSSCETEWSKSQKLWCFHKEGLQCGNGYSCTESTMWSPAETEWCCEYKRMCDRMDFSRQQQGNDFDCNAGRYNWLDAWSDAKKEWCCTHRVLGCAQAHDYDCDDAFQSPEHQDWCCKKEGKGCLGLSTHSFRNPLPPLPGHRCPVAFVQHTGFYCASLSSGDESDAVAPAPSRDKFNVTLCKYECELEPRCAGIVMHDGPTGGVCMLQSKIDLDVCQTMTEWNTWVKSNETDCGPFDCAADLHDFHKAWSPAKKAWCCKHVKVGCSGSEAPTGYNCGAGYDNWEIGWSRPKKDWCCQHHHAACGKFDCKFLSKYWEQRWSSEKKAYCCATENIGCKPKPLYDCNGQTPGWDMRWAPDKKEYCCSERGVACTPFDCDEGYDNWHENWNVAKQDYCCIHEFRGCRKVANVLPYDCTVGWGHWQTQWSENKREYCCLPGGLACTPYNCHDGIDAWFTAWSPSKKVWCCQHEHLGCQKAQATITATSTAPPHDCNSGLETWEEKWTAEKRKYCCEHGGRGCAPHNCYDHNLKKWSEEKREWCCTNEPEACAAEISVDCKSGVEAWEYEWSDEKKEACCALTGERCAPFDCQLHEQKYWSPRKFEWCCKYNDICTTTTTTSTTTTYQYDCHAGLPNWRSGWSFAKKDFCCQHYNLGCVGDMPNFQAHHAFLFHCLKDQDPADWEPEQQAWCCDHHKFGCDFVKKFDCDAEYATFEQSWTIAKKAYCCEHTRRACPTSGHHAGARRQAGRGLKHGISSSSRNCSDVAAQSTIHCKIGALSKKYGISSVFSDTSRGRPTAVSALVLATGGVALAYFSLRRRGHRWYDEVLLSHSPLADQRPAPSREVLIE